VKKPRISPVDEMWIHSHRQKYNSRWAVVHLTSEEAKFVIGAGLAVDGGNTVLDGSGCP
jgi:hypothetical protein